MLSITQKRRLKKLKDLAEKVLEPAAIFALLVVAITPVLATVNLTPQSSPTLQSTTNTPDVLGVKYEDNAYGVELVAGSHSVIKSEDLIPASSTDKAYRYSATLQPRGTGQYSKPILRAYNTTNNSVEIKISPTTMPTTSVASIIYKGITYKISDGVDTKLRTLTLEPGDREAVYLEVSDQQNINYREDLTVEVYILTN